MMPRVHRRLIRAVALAVAVVACAPAAADAQRYAIAVPHYDLDLPDNPAIEQQVEAGNKEVERLRKDDQTLDSDRDAYDYFNGLAARLLSGHQPPPPYPIVVHISTEPITNAEAWPGGQIVIYSHIFDLVDTEAELVGILAHEISHQLHDDFARFWHDYKTDRQMYGRNGVLEESQAIEAAADGTGVRLMYDAGWDPSQYVRAMKHLQAMEVRERGGRPAFYSTHPRDAERIRALEAEIATLPPKPNLVTDSDQFEALKQRL